jgi:hypothetical protein
LSLLRQSDQSREREISTERTGIPKLLKNRGYTFDRLKESGIEVVKISEVFEGIASLKGA